MIRPCSKMRAKQVVLVVFHEVSYSKQFSVSGTIISFQLA